MIPDKIKIGNILYTVSMEHDEYLTGGNLLGEICYPDQTIFIKSTLPEDRMESVFFHEVSHGMLYEMSHKDFDDEEIVDRFGAMLHQVVKENTFTFN